MANRITTVFEGDASKLKNALKDVGKAMGEAHGFTATLKAGVSGVLGAFKDFAKTPAGIATVTTAVASVGVAAVEAASKWADLGIEIGKFATAAGVSDVAASQWIETSKDLGVEVGATEKSLGFMNKTLGKTPGLFEHFGVTVAKTSSGAVDANGTFLNVIQRLKDIKDPAAQAAAGTALLGKSWQSMAEFISEGSTKLSEHLQSVEKQKIFDEEKVAKAKEFRATMDKLGDSFQDLALELGEKVLPLVEGLASGIADVVHAIDSTVNAVATFGDTVSAPFEMLTGGGAGGYLGEVLDKFQQMQEPIRETDRETRKLAGAMGAIEDTTAAATAATDAYERANQSMTDDVTRNLDEIQGRWDTLRGTISDDKSWLQLQQRFDELTAKMADATSNTIDNKIATDDLKLAVIDYGREVLKLPPETVTKIVGEIDDGSLEAAKAKLAIWAQNNAVNVAILAKGGAGYSSAPKFAQGGVVPGGRGQPSLAVVHGGELITQAGQAGSGGGPINVTVNMPVGSNGDDVVRALQRWERRNGPGWRS